MSSIKKIAITGPESTGKSWLANRLASHFGTAYVPEYAREYIDKLSGNYNRQDLYQIAREQLEREEQAASQAKRLLFCDTELLVIKIWSLHAFGECHPWILSQLEQNTYDLFLLCDIDLPWEPDPQREHPHLRKYFFDWYKRELDGYGFPYRVISGVGENRIELAVDRVNEFFIDQADGTFCD